MFVRSWLAFLLVIFGAQSFSGICMAQATGESGNPPVEVFVSSQQGDRLTRKTDAHFSDRVPTSIPVLKVAEDMRYQQIAGFGATFNEAGMVCLQSLPVSEQDRVLRSLFDAKDGAGFTVMKAPMAACDFASAGPWYSYDDTPGDTALKNFSIGRDMGPEGLVNYIRKASGFGSFQIETTMDFAPDWMMYGLKNGEKHVKPALYPVLARYYALYLKAYAAQGITINYLNPFNESENTWYSNVTYREIGELIKNHIVPEFRTEGLKTRIQLCESANRPEGLQKFPAVLDDPDARKHITTLTVHGYDWNQFETLSELHKRYPDIPIWQTEVCYAMPNNIPPNGPTRMPVYEFSDGQFWGNMIMNDMKHWASAWIYWNMILDQHGGPWLVSVPHGDPEYNAQHPVVIIDRDSKKVTYTGLYYYLAHFSRYIRPGAYRIACEGQSDQLNFAGFINKDGSIVVNIINNGGPISCGLSWKGRILIQDLNPHSITTFRWKS